MKIGFLGKNRMTRVYDASGKATPVTVIEAGPQHRCPGQRIRTPCYSAVGFDSQKIARHQTVDFSDFKKANSEPKKFVREFRLPDGTKVDGDLDISVNQFICGRNWSFKRKRVFRRGEKAWFCGPNEPPTDPKRIAENGAIGNRSTPGTCLAKHGNARTHGGRSEELFRTCASFKYARKRM